jgi:pyroglutamyl-peptidase
METKILVTGFDPFGGEPVNPAFEALKFLEGKTLAGHLVITQEIPTVRHKSIEVLKQAIARVNPALVVAVGQAGGRLEITPERVAINVDDFRIPDNEGNQPADEPIVVGAPTAYFTRLPVKAMVQAMKDAGIPASVSNTAGTFVCNHIFYGLMHLLAEEKNIRRGGFIHIPYMTTQAARLGNQPSMSIEAIAKGLEIAITTAATLEKDIRKIGGEIA